jgi:hypothetical protein
MREDFELRWVTNLSDERKHFISLQHNLTPTPRKTELNAYFGGDKTKRLFLVA